ncbi:MAG: hypothetical protein ACRDQX_09625 [Pseudonocardiaceae bacterium]
MTATDLRSIGATSPVDGNWVAIALRCGHDLDVEDSAEVSMVEPDTDMTTSQTSTTGGFALLRIHHVQLAIPRGGEDQCRAFWGDVLGMGELDKPSALAARGGCWFRGGDVEVHLGVEDLFTPARKAHPGLLVAGLSHLARRLRQAGYPVTWDGEFPGHDRFYSADPFGNRLEFLQQRSV